MFAYRGDGGDVVLRTSPLKSWTLVEGSRGRLQTSGVTEDGAATGVGNPHFCGYLRKGVCAEEYQIGCRSPPKEARGGGGAPVAY